MENNIFGKQQTGHMSGNNNTGSQSGLCFGQILAYILNNVNFIQCLFIKWCFGFLFFFVFVYILIIALVDIFDQIKYLGIGNDKRIELETILALVCCLSKFMFLWLAVVFSTYCFTMIYFILFSKIHF